MKKQLKVIELFAGIGAPRKALIRGGYNFKIVDAIEIDKYAVKSYNAIYNANIEPKDVCEYKPDKIDIGEIDLLFHGSPCQDFSLAGKQAGGDKDSGTRSSLMYETIRIVEELKPKYVIWENVKNLLSKKHKHNFDAYLEKMKQLGYTNYYQVLNAKDYGIPQNRERVFTVSILGDEKYDFPKGKKLEKLPIDLIEENADKKYDLTEKNIKHYQREFGSKGKELNLYEPIPTLTASMGTGGGNIPYFAFPPKQPLKLKLKDILEDEVDEKYYLVDNYLEFTNFYTIPRGSDGKLINGSYNRVWKKEKHCGSINLTKMQEIGEKDYINNLRIRKLTPLEVWRLMGFDDEDFEKASQVNSDTQLYKQAGNSIVVNVLEAIFDNLLQEYK